MILEISTFKHPDIVHGFTLKDVSFGFIKWSYSNFKVYDLKQIHSNIVLEAGRAKRGDALVTSEPGKILVIKTADCLPILFHEPEAKIIGAAHAGWRGLAKGLLLRVVEKMREKGAEPKKLRVAIGPAIGPCCYKVGEEVFRAFENNGTLYVRKGEKLDLFETAVQQLKKAGLERDNIHLLPLCTYCNEIFFPSFRRERVLSSQILSFIGLIKRDKKNKI